MVSLNQVKIILTSFSLIVKINATGEAKKQPNWIKFSRMDSRTAIHNLELNQKDDNNSNISDDSFVPCKQYTNEFNDKLELQRGPINENQKTNSEPHKIAS